MKKTTLFLFAICSAAMSYSADKWFGDDRNSQITDPTNWYLDEERTIQADSAPTSGGQDTAIMYSEKTDWRGVYLSQTDTYLYNVVITGNHHMNFGDDVLDKGKVYIDITGELSSPIIGKQSNPEIGTSFGKSGEVAVEMHVGEINVGTEIYRDKTFSYYGGVDLRIGTPDNRITDWNLLVDRDIRIGGGLYEFAGCVLNLYVDKLSVNGVLRFDRNGSSYSNMFFSRSATFEVGGIDATNIASNFTLHNSNAKDDATDILGRQSGTYTVKNGRLIMDNSRIAADYRQAKLSMEGGKFGAGHYDSSQTGTAYFKTANFKSGGFAYENFVNHNVFDYNPSDKVIITDTFTKEAGSGKISIDFSDANGNALNLADYDYILADSAESIEMWTEILTASELSGFNLEKRLSDGVYDANDDFVAEGIANGIAVFKWVDIRCK